MTTMTDRELLELAAKAAGLMHTPTKSEFGLFLRDEFGSTSLWNPLEDDGPALRLAVKLNMRVSLEFDHVEVEAPGGFVYIRENFSADPYLATRRAIALTAAAIGEATP